MINQTISSKRFCLWSGCSGIAGVVLLIISFNINPGPQPNATLDQLIKFGTQYYAAILWGAWLQAVAPVLIVLFAFSLVKLAGATGTLAGWMTMFGAVVLMIVSLIEITFYIAAVFISPKIGILISLNTIHAVQHLYFIVAAPTLFISLGVVLYGSQVLHRAFAWFAFFIGISFGVIGMVFLLELVLPMWVTAIAGIQAIWWLAASISLIVRSGKLAVV
ncbi:hypothetical protein BH09BAC6_BH09BAC6_22670 [soil metagenome]|jgi:hypothetical protein